jgi:hypothetical protein
MAYTFSSLWDEDLLQDPPDAIHVARQPRSMMRPASEMIETPYGEEEPHDPLLVRYSTFVKTPDLSRYKYPHFASICRTPRPLQWSQDKERSFFNMTGDMEHILPFTPERIGTIKPVFREFLYDDIKALKRAYDNTVVQFFEVGPDVVPHYRVQTALVKIRMAVDRDDEVLTDEYSHMLSLVFVNDVADPGTFLRLIRQGEMPRIRAAIEKEETTRLQNENRIREQLGIARRAE